MTISLLRLWSRRFLDSDYPQKTSKIFSLPTPYSTHEYTMRYGGGGGGENGRLFRGVDSGIFICIEQLQVVHHVRLGGWEGE